MGIQLVNTSLVYAVRRELDAGLAVSLNGLDISQLCCYDRLRFNKLAPTSVERLVFVNTVKRAYCLPWGIIRRLGWPRKVFGMPRTSSLSSVQDTSEIVGCSDQFPSQVHRPSYPPSAIEDIE